METAKILLVGDAALRKLRAHPQSVFLGKSTLSGVHLAEVAWTGMLLERWNGMSKDADEIRAEINKALEGKAPNEFVDVVVGLMLQEHSAKEGYREALAHCEEEKLVLLAAKQKVCQRDNVAPAGEFEFHE